METIESNGSDFAPFFTLEPATIQAIAKLRNAQGGNGLEVVKHDRHVFIGDVPDGPVLMTESIWIETP